MRRWFSQRRGVLIGVVLALVLFVSFEAVARLVTPDTVYYEIQTINPVGPGFTRSGTITDAATIARWRSAMTAHPLHTLSDAYFSAWWGNGCANGTVENATATFTWHGLPVEVVTPGPGCAGGSEVWWGVLPNLHTYDIDFDSLLR